MGFQIIKRKKLMKKVVLLFLFFSLFFPIFVHSARICVWNYDTLDRFYDPYLGNWIDCAYWVKKILKSQGHTVEVFTTLPTDLSQYDVVFCLMGWWRC